MTGPPEDHGPALNTDRELWRERADDYYAPSIFVTESGGIGITVGGTVFVKPIRAWFALAEAAEPLREAYEGPHGEVLYRPVGLTGPRGTPLDLRAVEARLMAATPGPWEAGVTQVRAHIGDKEPIIAVCANATARGYYGADVDFIAHAPDDMAALLAHCRALRAALNEYLEEHWQERAPEVWMCGMCRRAAAVLAQGKDEP